MRALALLLAILLAPGAAAAAESPRARASLLPEAAAVAPGQPFRLALRLELAPGWHAYWTNPGDAGEAPALDLTLPDGGAAGPLAFPAPRRIPYGPLVNFGYLGDTLLPLTLTPPATLEPGRLYTVEAAGRWLVCAEVCIPEEANFRLDLPVEAAPRPDPAAAALFRDAEAALPRPLPFAARAGFEGARGAIEIAGPALAPGAVREAFFFPDVPGLIDNTAPQPLTLRDGALTLALTRGTTPLPPDLSGVVAITDAAGVRAAYALTTPLGPVPGGTPLPWWQALAWAALGGLILNLMPCVFPVLAMKAMGIARLSGAPRAAVRGAALAHAAGVVLAFLAIGGALVAARAAGTAAGWGFQFTSPVFVAAMAWLMLAVGLNLSGVFAVGGPAFGAPSSSLWVGGLGTGALSVLVATPCTAPFMAAALGAALAMPPAGALAVFGAMGLGMAAPHALLAAAPSLAARLPRPGAWMERLRQFLAFPMYATAAWLAWVASVQSGPDGLAWLLAGALLVALAAWALGTAQAAAGGRTGRILAGAALAGALALLPQLAAAPPPALAVTGEPWSEARLAALRAEGRPVFLNLTAAWCITCRVNERVALETEATRAAFAAAGVALLTGDWTRGDPAISALLRAQGREGVPLYLLYPAGGGPPLILPPILTERMVIEALATLPAPRPPASRSTASRSPASRSPA